MTRGIWGCILSELKEYTPRPPKKNSGRDGVVTSSISLAAAQRAPAHSFRCSSFSHRKTLRWEPCNFPPRPSLKRPKEGGQGRVVAGRLLRVPRQRRAQGSSLVKCRVLPDDLFVRHGVQCAEVCGRPRPCSRRGCRVWGQDSLGPFPPAVCGRREGVFSFDGSTAVFFLPLAKRKWGWKAAGVPRHPRLVNRAADGTPYLGHGLRQPNSGTEFGASVRSSCPTSW